MINHNQHITISAAGKATRIRDWMHQEGYPEGTPKSALMTGAGETLLGRIVRQAMPVGDVTVYGNYDTIRGLGECPDLPRDVSLMINRNIIGPLGPIYLDALRTRKQSYMAAGDFWAEFSWQHFIDFHNSHEKPASILVAPSVRAKDGARFIVNQSGAVKAWERVEETSETDLINIGAYIIDGQNPHMRKIIRKLNNETHKEDAFNDVMIAANGLAAYVLDTPAFNVNNADIYKALVAHSADRPAVGEPLSYNPIEFAPGAP